MKTRTQRAQPAPTPAVTEVAPKSRSKGKLVKLPSHEPVVAEDAEFTATGRRRGQGRPKIPDDQRKTESIYVCTTKAEKDWLEQQAADVGMTLSYYIRKRLKLALDSAKKPAK